MNQNKIVGKRYQIVRELGKNNWCITYLAKDMIISDSSYCVVQQFQLTGEETQVKNIIERDTKTYYANETYLWQRLASNLESSAVFTCFESENSLYLVREYIEGKNLTRRLEQDGLLDEKELIGFLKDSLFALEFIHQQGVIHQDLKPTNIIVRDRDRRVSIVGFGAITAIIDRPIAHNESTTITFAVNEYYPSEQAMTRMLPSRDIYALGAIAIEAVTGKKPRQIPPHFPVKTFLARENCLLGFRLVGIIERMMSLDPTRNYASAREVLNELEEVKPRLASSELLADPLNVYPLEQTGMLQLQDRIRDRDKDLHERNLANEDLSRKPQFKPKYLLAAGIGLLLLAGIGEVLFPFLRPRYHCYRGDRRLAEEQPEAALNSFQQATDLNSRSICGWLGEARSLYGLERYRAALAAYDRVDRLKPDLTETWQGRGEVLYRLERFEAANTAYNKTLNKNPDNAVIWNRKGKALYQLELYNEALAAQDRALRIQPDYAQALSDRGIALIGAGEYQKALESFNQAQEIDPRDPKLWQNKALALQYLNRPQESMRLYQEALEAYEEVIQENPKNITALLDKANVLSQLQRHEQALLTYEQAIAVNEDSHLAWLGKGNALYALRRYEEAKAAFNRAVKVQPKSYISWHNRGSLLRDGMRNLSEAISSYDRSLEINPNFYHAWRDRGIALSQNQQQQEAIESFKKALNIKPSDYKSWVGQGIALSSLGKIDEAISVFDRAAEIQPNDPFVWMNRGTILETAGRYAEACDAYREVKKINPAFSPAVQKLQQLNCRQ